MTKTVDVKLTEKEEKAIATVVAFFQGLKDCKKEDEEKYLIENAFASRMILSFSKAEPKNAHTILSSALINDIIPYLVAKKEDSIDKIAEEFDKKTDKMMEDVIKHREEIMGKVVEEKVKGEGNLNDNV
jgi:hypothetical protein